MSGRRTRNTVGASEDSETRSHFGLGRPRRKDQTLHLDPVRGGGWGPDLGSPGGRKILVYRVTSLYPVHRLSLTVGTETVSKRPAVGQATRLATEVTSSPEVVVRSRNLLHAYPKGPPYQGFRGTGRDWLRCGPRCDQTSRVPGLWERREESGGGGD